ncbi:MAG TPA: ATP-binding protein [Ramlibacter sp.]|nr:ATP-binding protein [Ramlibacter sp.]
MAIFRGGPMCSIRRTLMAWLGSLFVAVGIASAAISYFTYDMMVTDFMDHQMQLLGDSIAAQERPMPPPAESMERVLKHGMYITAVFDAGGRQLSSAAPLALSPPQAPGFHDVIAAGRPWRAYLTAESTPDGHRVAILQSSEFRKHLAKERAAFTVLPVIVLMVLATWMLWMLAAAIARELQGIGRQAAKQDEYTIAELPLERVPREIVPLVSSFNSLLSRLREAFASQRRFMQDAAHELRTPITAVALQLENVRRDMPPGACAASLLQLEAGVSRAQRMMDQLLKVSRREATVMEAVPVDLQAQVRESINALIALADQRHIDLGLVGDMGAPAMTVHCAAADLRSVLDNLVENALRYTPQGGVVDVRLARENGRAIVEVVDTGPGIAPDQIERVFDRFFRVPGNDDTRGSGLGLAIAQSAARRCGLRIALRNRPDRSGLIARVEPA